MRLRRTVAVAAIVMVTSCLICLAGAQNPVAAPATDTILRASDVTPRIFPATVFFRGQVAGVQMDNVGGVRYADGKLVLAGLVDSSGYASQYRQKYQGYLIVEVPLEIAGQTLKSGAYGFGFLDNDKFVIMDLGGNDVVESASVHDTEIQHPIPLQFIGSPGAGAYRLYHGRDYVQFHRAY